MLIMQVSISMQIRVSAPTHSQLPRIRPETYGPTGEQGNPKLSCRLGASNSSPSFNPCGRVPGGQDFTSAAKTAPASNPGGRRLFHARRPRLPTPDSGWGKTAIHLRLRFDILGSAYCLPTSGSSARDPVLPPYCRSPRLSDTSELLQPHPVSLLCHLRSTTPRSSAPPTPPALPPCDTT